MCLLEQLHLAPAIDHGAEQLAGAFGVIHRRMCLAAVERMAGGQHGLAQYGLPEGKATEADRVETAEWMERIAFVSAAAHGLVQEAEIERGVVANQDRSLATG